MSENQTRPATPEAQAAELTKLTTAVQAAHQNIEVHGVRLPDFTPEAFAKLAEAFSKAQGEIKQPAKASKNPAFNSFYADHTACVNAVTSCFAKHGLSFTQTVEADGRTVTVVTIVLHEAGAWLSSGPICIPIGQARNAAQAIGSAITYAKRYSLCATVGISADDDDDANAVGTPQKQPAQKTVQKPRTNPAAVRPIAPQPAPVPAPAALDPEEEAKRLQEFGWRIEEAETIDELKKIGLEISAIGFGPASKEALTRTWKERRETLKAAAPADDFEATYGA